MDPLTMSIFSDNSLIRPNWIRDRHLTKLDQSDSLQRCGTYIQLPWFLKLKCSPERWLFLKKNFNKNLFEPEDALRSKISTFPERSSFVKQKPLCRKKQKQMTMATQRQEAALVLKGFPGQTQVKLSYISALGWEDSAPSYPASWE